jgi:DNA-binding response OmpR family regulator
MSEPTVLIVDDEPVVLSIASTILSRAGFRTLRAESAEQALQLCKERAEPIQLALLDVLMPGINGIELRDRLCERFPDLVALYMSGYTHSQIEARGAAIGAASFVQKPFQPAALVERVRAALADGGDQVGLVCG